MGIIVCQGRILDVVDLFCFAVKAHTHMNSVGLAVVYFNTS